MKSFWLKRKPHAQRLLAIYQGWGRSAADLADFAVPQECDCLVFFDYTEIPETPPADAARYGSYMLLAWSLGVWAAAHSWGRLWQMPVDAALAVNGTLEPMSREYGIAPEIFLGTAENWLSPTARRKFEFRMNLPAACGTDRTPEEQQKELFALADAIRNTARPDNIFTRAVVGGRDRIFPAAAQLAAWRRCGWEPEVRPELGHWIWEEDWSDDAGCTAADR